ncbi:hypothetical protein KUTeg_015346 [Tegillarca granosa]|uniref:SOCS box domain-containing protein n=1 Tax=Tegillarca granosa TaxID=220873 RepID=A0ABQ9ETH1_TEGGR|nr:hypothetical protein KUTeg_015346 [Tegillarca granosa]
MSNQGISHMVAHAPQQNQQDEGMPSEPILSEDLLVEIPSNEDTLYKAVRLNDHMMIERLIRQNTDLNMKNMDGVCMVKSRCLSRHIRMTQYTPLQVAALHASMETIELLTNNGADVNVFDGNNRSPLHYATAAARLDVVQHFIKTAGADVNTSNYKQGTPLMNAACGVRNPGLVKLLLDRGANVNLIDTNRMSAFRLCLESNQLYIPLMLLQHGADINAANKYGSTPLAAAVRHGQFKIIQFLLTRDCKRDPEILKSERMEQLCDLYKVFGDWFRTEMSTPWTLLRCCRYHIRNTIPPQKLGDLSTLPIPKTLIRYLQHGGNWNL